MTDYQISDEAAKESRRLGDKLAQQVLKEAESFALKNGRKGGDITDKDISDAWARMHEEPISPPRDSRPRAGLVVKFIVMTLAVAAAVFLVFELTATNLPSIGTAALVVGTIGFFYMLASANVRVAIAAMTKAVAGALGQLRMFARVSELTARSRRGDSGVDRAGSRWQETQTEIKASPAKTKMGFLGIMPMSPPEDTSAGSPQSHTAGDARPKVMDYRTLRAVIGGIVILVVPVVYIGNWLIFIRHPDCFYNPHWIPGSLSGFYYTHMRSVFVGAMCAVGVFLIAYRGHDRWDDRLTNVAGLAAICIGLFPTMPPPNQFFTRANPCGPSTLITYNLSPHQSWIRDVHVVSLFVLFLMVFLMVLIQFTRTKPSKAERQPPVRGSLRAWWKALFSVKQLARRIRAWWRGLFAVKERRVRNRVFVACAGGIALSALLALFTAIWSSAGKNVPLLLFAESLAFWCFGIAWFVKGVARTHTRPAGDTQD